MPRVSKETIAKLNDFICALPEEAKGKCALCNQTLVHIVKQAEAQTGAGTATVTRVLAENINETALPQDQVTSSSLNEKVRNSERDRSILVNDHNKIIEDLEKQTEKEIIKQAKVLNAEKTAVKKQKKHQAYQDRVNAVQVKKEISPPDLILADPPWRYDFSETTGRKIENHYNTESVSGMEGHIPDTKPDCILLLWATAPKLQEAFELMKAWGFKYKTCAVWDKEIIGMGYWFRGQHELLLVGVKGKVSPPLEEFRVSSVFREARTEHSKKPECVYEWIEKAFGDKNKLEMYCRTPRLQWQTWGNEV